MDTQAGVQVTVSPFGSLEIDSETSVLTIGTLSGGEGTGSIPGVLRNFFPPVSLRGIRLTWLSAESTSTPELPGTEASTTPEHAGVQEETILVHLKVLIKRSGDEEFTEVSDQPNNAEEVRGH